MVNKCYLCNKRHSDVNWRTQVINGEVVDICSLHFRPTNHEFIPQRIKDDREKFAKSTLQPWREGNPSAEFIEAYPERAKKMFTVKERLTAKEVWKGEISKHWRKSK